jgi:ABC-type enterochelin transport system permease subunit
MNMSKSVYKMGHTPCNDALLLAMLTSTEVLLSVAIDNPSQNLWENSASVHNDQYLSIYLSIYLLIYGSTALVGLDRFFGFLIYTQAASVV